MAIDRNTWGFSKPDAEALKASIGGGETEIPDRLPGGGGGIKLFGFALTSSMSSNSAAADISTLDGISTSSIESSTVYDPQSIFSVLEVGDTGLCVKQGGKYYIVQANCPDDEASSFASSNELSSVQAPEPPLPPV